MPRNYLASLPRSTLDHPNRSCRKFVGGASAAGLPPALVDVCRARHAHGPLFWSAYAAGFFSLAEKSSFEKNLGPFCSHKNTSFFMTCIYIIIKYVNPAFLI